MNRNTKLETVVKKLVEVSVLGNKLSSKKVNQIIDTLKTLSKDNAIRSLTLYLKGLKRYLNQSRLVIHSPIPLTNSQIDEIVKQISSKRSVFETEVVVNKSLIGGIKVKIGDDVYDKSILNRIDQLKKAIEA